MKFSGIVTMLAAVAAFKSAGAAIAISEPACEELSYPYPHMICSEYQVYTPSPALLENGEIAYLGGYGYIFNYSGDIYGGQRVEVSWEHSDDRECKAYMNGQMCNSCFRCDTSDSSDPVKIDCLGVSSDGITGISTDACTPLADGVFRPFALEPEISKAIVITNEFSEEGAGRADCPQEHGLQSVISGLYCRNSHCDNLRLQCSFGDTMVAGRAYETLGLSDEQGEHSCPTNYAITGLKCSGRYCDKIHLQCTEMAKSSINYDLCDETAWVNEENEFVSIPQGAYPVGMKCAGDFCGDKKIIYCFA